jgi:hypothetical protein
MEPNPYKAPRPSGQLARRAGKGKVGLGVMLLLTPPAMVIAVMGSCAAAMTVDGRWRTWVFFGLSFAALIAALVTIQLLTNRAAQNPSGRRALARILWSTPIVVGISWAVGLGCAIVVYLAVGSSLARRIGPDDAARAAKVPAAIVFWCVPAISLVLMLLRAWIVGKGHSSSQSASPDEH